MNKELKNIKKYLSNGMPISECINEAYFSNSLAWLMNPNEKYNRVEFINKFAKLIANKRAKESRLKHSSTTIKAGRNGYGTNYRKFNFANSNTIREYHLSKSLREDRSTNFCDVVLIDLDIPNSIIITVESKLQGAVNKIQLGQYYKQCEAKFSEVKTREYVVIGLDKETPKPLKKDKNWIYLSWINDIYPIVKQMETKSKRIKEFHSVLNYLNNVYTISQTNSFELYSTNYLNAISVCLLDELNRLKTNRGEWIKKSSNSNQIAFFHSSARRKTLYIDYLSNMNIAIQSHNSSNKPLYEKVCIPFGLSPQQLSNQLVLFSKDIYKYHFGKNYSLYLNNNHRRNLDTKPFPKIELKVFEECYKYSGILKHLLQLNNNRLIKKEYK